MTSEEGLTSVVKAGPKFELLAENGLDDFTLASPVAVRGGRLLLRTSHHLYCVGGAAKGAARLADPADNADPQPFRALRTS